MDFIQQVQIWTRGEIEQGKWMLAISIVLVPFIFLLMKSENTLSRGLIIPLSILFLVLVGYGSYLVIGRAGNTERIENQYQINSLQTIEDQYHKTIQDNKTYTILKSIWAAMVIVFILIYFFTKQYHRGLSLGFAVMFLGIFITDTFLHNRLEQYFATLKKHVSKTELFLAPPLKKEIP